MTEFSPRMRDALALAEDASRMGEVPVGALIVDASGRTLAAAANRTETDHDPCAHAEVLAIRAACRALGSPRLPDCDLYVTLEPCPMCAAAISLARIRRVIFGAYDPKSGGVEHGPRIYAHATCHHRPEVIGGVLEADCGALLKDFFGRMR